MYRGAAHYNCYLKYRIPDHIPIVFHNLSGYDAHLLIRDLGKKFNNQDTNVIAENKEKYISFNVSDRVKLAGVSNKDGKSVYKKIQLRFIDSCRFMASSLGKLSGNLCEASGVKCNNCRNDGMDMKTTIPSEYKALFECKKCKSNKIKQFSGIQLKESFDSTSKYWCDDEKFRLLLRKGVYPYEYIDSWEKFNEHKLPPKKVFYSRLSMKGISDEDYKHAQQVWGIMEKKTLGCYHDMFLKTDVLLLADVFEKFRDTCLQQYKLHPAHFYTALGSAWKATLKITGIELELLTDIDMLLMFEKGIRGGITQAVKRYCKANNRYMGILFKPEELSKFLQYLDANNLYGWAMCLKLPTKGFKWVKNVGFFYSR